MKTMKIWRLALAILAAFSLVSCSSDDDDKDITKEIIMNVSAEPGVMYDLFDSTSRAGGRTYTSAKSKASLTKEVMNTCCA